MAKKDKPPVLTARERLRVWRSRRELTQREMATGLLSCTGDTLHHVERGTRPPSLALAARIQSVTGIPAVSWVEAQTASEGQG